MYCPWNNPEVSQHTHHKILPFPIPSRISFARTLHYSVVVFPESGRLQALGFLMAAWLPHGSVPDARRNKGNRSAIGRSANLCAELCMFRSHISIFFLHFASIRYLLYVSLRPPPLASTSAWTTARHCDCMSKTSPRLCLRNALCRKAEMPLQGAI